MVHDITLVDLKEANEEFLSLTMQLSLLIGETVPLLLQYATSCLDPRRPPSQRTVTLATCTLPEIVLKHEAARVRLEAMSSKILSRPTPSSTDLRLDTSLRVVPLASPVIFIPPSPSPSLGPLPSPHPDYPTPTPSHPSPSRESSPTSASSQHPCPSSPRHLSSARPHPYHPTTTSRFLLEEHFTWSHGVWSCHHPSCVSSRLAQATHAGGGVRRRAFGAYKASRVSPSSIVKRAREHVEKHAREDGGGEGGGGDGSVDEVAVILSGFGTQAVVAPEGEEGRA